MSRDTEPGSAGVVETLTANLRLPPEGFVLESGQSLPELAIAYETCGALSPERDNVIFVCHALSGSAHAAGRLGAPDGPPGWWDEMIGPGKGIDTGHYHVICANILGGCYGTTGPSSIDPRTGRRYGSRFPRVTVGDIVHAHRLLLGHLGIERLAAVIGGSFGGMQVLDWSIRYPEAVRRCVCIASAARLSTQALAFDIVGRNAITSDPDWQHGDYYETGRGPVRGLAQARRVGHITYLSQHMMSAKFGRDKHASGPTPHRDHEAGHDSPFRSDFEVEHYLEHQGVKFVERFDANSYLHIAGAMDHFDLAERCETLDRAFAPIRAKYLIVALDMDWLFPPEQSMELASSLLRAGKAVSYCELHAPHGHDAFLVDIEHLSETLRAFLPWVGRSPSGWRPRRADPAPGATGPASEAASPPREQADRAELDLIAAMIEPGRRVLDLGCGSGRLLGLLARRREITGLGVEIDLDHVTRVIDGGHDVFQADLDAGLAMIPDGAYDYAVLSETLPVMRKPRFVLREMLRVAREGIVSFPNAGKWSRRLSLLLRGRMPGGGGAPCAWYDTPNIHPFTLRDFLELCREDDIVVLQQVCVADDVVGRLLVRLGWRNAGAARVLARIARRSGAAAAAPADSQGAGR